MKKHDCGCQTVWDDELDHPMYLKACFGHACQVPNGWMVVKPSPTRESVRV